MTPVPHIPQEPEKGFVINSKTLTTLVAILTIVGFLFVSVSKVNSWDSRISNLEQYRIESAENSKELLNELKMTNGNINNLRIDLEKTRVLVETNKKK